MFTYYLKGIRYMITALISVAAICVHADDVRIEELQVEGVPIMDNVIMLENASVKMTIQTDGTLAGLVDKATGKDYRAVTAQPMFSVLWGGVRLLPRSVRLDKDILTVAYPDDGIEVQLKVAKREHYFTFEVVSVREDLLPGDSPKRKWKPVPERVDEISIVELPVRMTKTRAGGMNACWNEEFAAAVMALKIRVRGQLRSLGSAGTGLAARGLRKYGLVGSKAAVIACPQPQFTSVIQKMEAAEGLACPMYKGKWLRESELVKQSYYFAIDLCETNAADVIRYAKMGGFPAILILTSNWRKSAGHYEVNPVNFPHGREGLKQVVAKAHAAGLRIGVHVDPGISRNDPYATPIPDPRLAGIESAVLAESIDAKAARIVTGRVPELCPRWRPIVPNSRPRNIIQIGDELVAFGKLHDQRPFGFSGCRRGYNGTTPTRTPWS